MPDYLGNSRVVFTTRSANLVVEKVLGTLYANWPLLSAECYDSLTYRGTYSGQELVGRCRQLLESDANSHLFIYCKPELIEHFDLYGFSCAADGTGPVRIGFRVRPNFVGVIDAMSEIRCGDLEGHQPPDRYRAWIAARLLVEVTVTPPESHESRSFSEDIVQLVISSCVD